jgi:tetratricopeptide (TPR) repeat protein
MSAAELKAQGNAALQSENFTEAIQFYTQAIDIDPSNHILYSNRSAAYAKTNEFANSLNDAEKTIELKNDWPKGYSRKGAALELLDKYDEAIVTYEAGLKVDPTNQQLNDALANCKDNVKMPNFTLGGGGAGGNPFSDPKLLASLAMNPKTRDLIADKEVRDLLQGLQKNPNDIAKLLAHPKASQLLQAMFSGMGGGMGDAFESAMDGDEEPMQTTTSEPTPTPKPKEPTPDPNAGLTDSQKEAAKEKEMGNDFYKKKDFENAHLHYEKAIEHDSTNITFYTNNAAVYFEEDKLEKCIEICEKAIEVGRENQADYKLIAKAIARIGNSYHKQKDLEKALKWYNSSLSEHRNPDILKKKQQIEKDIKEKLLLAQLDPVKAEESKQQGNELYKKGDFPGAMKFYNQSAIENPADPKLFRNRAACLSKLMEFPSALKDCDEAIKVDPSFVKAYVQKGSILMVLKEKSKAQAAYAKALELDPTCGEAIDGYRQCAMENSLNPEEARARAMEDPEVQRILGDPAMRMILEQMQTDPKAVQDHLKNPEIKAKLQKLIESGLIQVK